MRIATPLSLVLLLSLAAPLGAHEDDPKILDKRPRYEGEGYRRGQTLKVGPDGRLLAPQAAGVAAKAERGGSAPFTAADFVSDGVTLLSWLPIGEFGSHTSANDCWGYVSGSGREYAILGLSDGIGFVEITDPDDAQIVSVQPEPASLWHDIKTYETYAYSVNETDGGVYVYDLANIDAGVVSFVGNFAGSGAGTPKTHNVAIDVDSGFLYRCGGGNHGLRIYSLANPANPTYITAWNDRYVHDAQIVTYTSGPYAGRQIAFACTGYDAGSSGAGLDVIDVTNKSNLINLARTGYSDGAYSHQGWLSEDRQYFYLNDELNDKRQTAVFNVSNINSPFETATYPHGNFAIAHNTYTRGGFSFHSNYTAGLQVFDLTNPTAPTEVSSFDTSPNLAGQTFNGLWSNYPYFPSGTVIGSDIENGLFVWQLEPLAISFDFPTGLPDFTVPGAQTEILFDLHDLDETLAPGTVALFADTGSGFMSTPVVSLGGDSYRGMLPATSCGNRVDYFVAAEAESGVTWTSPPLAPEQAHSAVASLPQSTLVSYNMESVAGWTTGAPEDDAVSGFWLHYDPVGTEAQPDGDHTPGASNTLCWVTGNASFGAPSGFADVDGGQTTLSSPSLDLSGVDEAVISYWRWYSNGQGSNPNEDVFTVSISDDGGTNWVVVEELGPMGLGTSGGWFHHQFRVSDFVPHTSNMRVRFVASDEGGPSLVEAAIDDFAVTEVECDTLTVDVDTVSLATGSQQTLSLDAGDALAGELFWLLGSTAGTSPGLPLGSFVLPLVPDFYFNVTLAGPNLLPLGNSLGTLSASGTATSTFGLQPGSNPSLVGITAYHAAVVLDASTDDLLFVSNPVAVRLIP